MTFSCEIYSAGPARTRMAGRPLSGEYTSPVVTVRYDRTNRADTFHDYRPSPRAPQLSLPLARAISSTLTMLVVNLGAWEFEDGCYDIHSLHDAYCNGTRPNILYQYALKWSLVAGALNHAYRDLKNASLVLLRTASPRDFEGGSFRAGGYCRRTAPLSRAELVASEKGRVDPTSMRFVVLAKNLMMDAVAIQRIPWVHILDAYEVARARADAHPGRLPEKSRIRPAFDCLHYCLPGVPDVYNGRLSSILHRVAASPSPSEEERGDQNIPNDVPGCVIRQFNFDHGDAPFVAVFAPRQRGGAESVCPYSLQLHLLPSPAQPVAIECEDMLDNGSIGVCSDLASFARLA